MSQQEEMYKAMAKQLQEKKTLQAIYDFFTSEEGLQMDEGSAKINAERLGKLLKEVV